MDQRVLIPVQLSAFVFNKAVCDGYNKGEKEVVETNYRIAPITQPNYSFVQLADNYLQADLMNNVDLHAAWPAERNSRFTNLTSKQPIRNRQGVYVHWTVPRVYRSSVPKELPKKNNPEKPKDNEPGVPPKEEQEEVQAYPEVPTRWLVIRKFENMSTLEPSEARTHPAVKEFTAWVVESDKISRIDDIEDSKDIQVEYAPFTNPTDVKKGMLKVQAEIFIGQKTNATEWSEEVDKKPANFMKLNLMGTSNELFADYQPHCSNVFSILDNFEYEKEKYITKAEASYYVLGWHALETSDLFYQKSEEKERSAILKSLNMKIKGSDTNTTFSGNISKWLAEKSAAHTVAHGSMYSVMWDVEKRPKTTPADNYGRLLSETLPVSVGTTPLNALLTYVKAHQNLEKPKDEIRGDEAPEINDMAEALLSLEKYLMARDDGVESQLQAADMLYNWNYLRLDGGSEAHVSGNQDGATPSPPDDLKKDLTALNKYYRLYDACARRLTQLQWNLFSEWWKYVILVKDDQTKQQRSFKDSVSVVLKKLENLEKSKTETAAAIVSITKKYPTDLFQAGTLPTFYQQRDPTMLIGGIKSGWQPDFLEDLPIRLDTQILTEAKNPSPGETAWIDIIEKAVPARAGMRTSAIALVREFILLKGDRKDKTSQPVEQEYPLFHDAVGEDKPNWRRDQFDDSQPWSPLFLEWEVEYIHVPLKDYAMEEHVESHHKNPKLHYIIKPEVDLAKNNQDIEKRNDRKFSGRVLLLPQPSFSLQAKVDQLFSDTPEAILDEIINHNTRAKLTEHLKRLPFLSAPMSGFTSAMKTMDQGNHVKPLFKNPDDGKLSPIGDAVRTDIGLGEDQIIKMDEQTDVTPYGSSKSRLSDYPSFKPATHGQFKFTQLNIIDKFGQSISAIDPTPTEDPQPLWPCISEWYAPQIKKGTDNVPNIIDVDKKHPDRCEYVQIPPQINQAARLNATFVVPSPETAKECMWKPSNDYISPIFGWVVVNYANYGLQLFLADGTFYREARIGGPTGSLESPEWLPFSPPENPEVNTAPGTQQLSRLVTALVTAPGYLQRFVGMINEATKRVKAPPSAYAEFINALVGRPLALTHVGWSLELDSDFSTTQLDADKNALEPEPALSTYNFPIKIGDRDRSYDGLVGFWDLKKENRTIGDALACENTYSHFVPDLKGAPMPNPGAIRPIDKTNYFTLSPYWLDPAALKVDAYALETNKKLHVKGALVDPFTPVHAYSGILPIKELSLPQWTWSAAMDKMKAFFHAGPVLVTADIPDLVPSRKLKAGKPLDVVTPSQDEKRVAIPSIPSSQWAWLQPYMPATAADELNTRSAAPSTAFMALAIDTLDDKARLEEGPYTALEGYLQLVTGPNEKAENTG